jgi:hypothetical protein
VNEIYNLVVSEPWDYSGIDGKNKISGVVVRRVGVRCLVFRPFTPVRLQNVSGEVLVLFPRYQEDTFRGDFVGIPANVGILLTNDYNGLNEKQLELNAQFVIIGSLEDCSVR